MNQLFEHGKWIGAGGGVGRTSPVRPAPFFRKNFTLEKLPEHAEVFFSGLGYSELYLNGKKVDDGVLQPVVTQYDKRAGYLKYDITSLLQVGENVFGAILGNGWYNCSTENTWYFERSSWRDYPKMILELYCDGVPAVVSDHSWKCSKGMGPLRFDALREGETYDARMEMPGWNTVGFDDSGWFKSAIVPGPGGVMTEQTMPPCKVTKLLPAVRVVPGPPKDAVVYDVGQIITGWCRIKVRGERGAKIKLIYSELMDHYNVNIDRKDLEPYVFSDKFQTDEYILKGDGLEEWEPRFVYHGFRYIRVETEGQVELTELTGCVVHTAFDFLTEFESSDPVLNQLHQMTHWSFIDNYTGIPTDCPHREKNGWTGDTLQASEMGLFHYDLESSYRHWLQIMADTQRPNGQFPGIVPTNGWGFNWGSGPAWDSAFLLIPWNVYVYTGKTRILKENYGQMKQYMKYLASMATDHILSFGLGDWCPVDLLRMTDIRITSTGYYYADAVMMQKTAALLGYDEDSKQFGELAETIKNAFHKAFYRGNGLYGTDDAPLREDDVTALATALYWGLCPESEAGIVAKRLNDVFVARQYKADFGILGAKYILRVLADYGYGETAYRILMQPAYPGWVNWINLGATTLWEQWKGFASHCHIMYGDIAAWMIQYLGGITPDESAPGFRALTIRPFAPQNLESLHVSSKLASGKVTVDWKKENGTFRLTLTIPEGIPCKVILPDGSEHSQQEPAKEYTCKL
ncbi:MAG: family 78 glycoside hydrolase catalytic domain [Lentisphaeria bacterium]|nr:family 78 glycoside hydrolase catalytic domain [Lentisphaeria bacterium]